MRKFFIALLFLFSTSHIAFASSLTMVIPKVKYRHARCNAIATYIVLVFKSNISPGRYKLPDSPKLSLQLTDTKARTVLRKMSYAQFMLYIQCHKVARKYAVALKYYKKTGKPLVKRKVISKRTDMLKPAQDFVTFLISSGFAAGGNGSKCQRDSQCILYRYCDAAVNMCITRQQQNSLCTADRMCKQGLKCISNRCRKNTPKKTHKKVVFGIDMPCKSNSDCKTGFCDTYSGKCRVSAGHDCMQYSSTLISSRCGYGYFCSPTSRNCDKGYDKSCQSDTDCSFGDSHSSFVCDSSKRRCRVKNGSRCSQEFACTENTYCNKTVGYCNAILGRRSEGQQCTAAFPCISGLVCMGGYCKKVRPAQRTIVIPRARPIARRRAMRPPSLGAGKFESGVSKRFKPQPRSGLFAFSLGLQGFALVMPKSVTRYNSFGGVFTLRLRLWWIELESGWGSGSSYATAKFDSVLPVFLTFGIPLHKRIILGYGMGYQWMARQWRGRRFLYSEHLWRHDVFFSWWMFDKFRLVLRSGICHGWGNRSTNSRRIVSRGFGFCGNLGLAYDFFGP